MPDTQAQVQHSNEQYRAKEDPEKAQKDAFVEAVLTGELTDETTTKLINNLWYKLEPRHRNRDSIDPDNGRGIIAEKRYDGILVRITEPLWREQPRGVLLGDLHQCIAQEGTAIIERVSPSSESVVPETLPHDHISVKIVPTAIWLAKFIGEDGFPTLH